MTFEINFTVCEKLPFETDAFFCYSSYKMLQLFLLATLSGILSLLYYWAKQKQNYWKDRNIPHVKSPLLLGHFFKTVILKQHNIDALTHLYDHPNAKGKPFVGINVFHKV